MNEVLAEKKVKRKKSMPRFISVQPDGLVQFMKEVAEYKQILRSIGMYDLSQNWKQTREQQRKKESEARKQAKLQRKKEKEEMERICFAIKEKQKAQEGDLEKLQGQEHQNERIQQFLQDNNCANKNQKDNIQKDKQPHLNEVRKINQEDGNIFDVKEDYQFRETDKEYHQQQQIQQEDVGGQNNISQNVTFRQENNRNIQQTSNNHDEKSKEIKNFKQINKTDQSQELQNESDRSNLSPQEKINKIKKKKKKKKNQ